MEIKYYFIILCSLILYYIIGRILSSLIFINFKQNNYYKTFLALVIGLFISITVFAIAKTRVNTVMIGLAILFILWIFKSKKINFNVKNFKSNLTKNLFNDFLIIFIISLILCLLYGGLFFNGNFNNLCQGDYYFYSSLIFKISETGRENTILAIDPFFNGIIGASPYHYPELWLSVFYYEIFNILPLVSILIISHVILATILSIGILALAQEFSNSIIVKIFALLSLFFSGLLLFEPIFQTSSFIDFGNIYTPKFSIISVFLVWYLILIIRKSELFYFPLLILPIINIATAPSVFIALSLYFILKAILSKNLKVFIFKFIDILIIAIFIAGFYLLQPKIPSANLSISEIIDVNLQDPMQILKTFGGGIIIFVSIYFWFFIPFMFYVIYKKLKTSEIIEYNYKDIFLFWVILFFSGLIIWNFTNPMHDSIQFHLLPTYMLINLMIFICFTIVYNNIKELKTIFKYLFYFFWIVLVSLNFLQLKNKAFFRYNKISDFYSIEYLENISKVIPQDYKGYIGLIDTTKEIKTSFDAQFYWNTMPPLANIIPNAIMLMLSSDDYRFLIDDYKVIKRAEKFIALAPFNKFCNEEDPKNLLNKDSLRLKFIKNNRIKYLIIKDQREISSMFLEITDSIISDPVSKEKFLILSYE